MELPEHQLLLRNLRPEDYADVRAIMDRVYRGDDMKTPERYFQAQVEMFPQGQICIEDHGTVVAAAFSVVVDYDKFGDSHTYKEITGDLLLTTHDPKGTCSTASRSWCIPIIRACDWVAGSTRPARSCAAT
jgi:hypothetical protein